VRGLDTWGYPQACPEQSEGPAIVRASLRMRAIVRNRRTPARSSADPPWWACIAARSSDLPRRPPRSACARPPDPYPRCPLRGPAAWQLGPAVAFPLHRPRPPLDSARGHRSTRARVCSLRQKGVQLCWGLPSAPDGRRSAFPRLKEPIVARPAVDAERMSKRSISGPEMRFSRSGAAPSPASYERSSPAPRAPGRHSSHMGRDMNKPTLFLRFEVTADLGGAYQHTAAAL
jgi:hypothetical protein